MARMTYVKVFVTFLEDIDRLNFEQRGRLFTAMLTYAKTGEEPDLPGNEGILWPNARRLIDDEERSYRDKCRKAKENAKKGVDKRKKNAESRKNQPSPADVSQEQEQEYEQEQGQGQGQEQEQGQEYCDTFVSQDFAPDGAHEPAQANDVWEGYGEELCDALSAWIRYKEERGQAYRRTGMDALKAQVAQAAAQYGEAAVIAVIHSSMAANYHCITFDRLARDAAKPPFGSPLPGSAAPSPAGWQDMPGEEYNREVEEWMRQDAMKKGISKRE